MKIKTRNIKRFLVFIEDRRFYSHRGIDYKSLLRGVLGLFKLKRRSGGSTIAQQVVRTLFISDLGKTYRRKFLELSLAPWLMKVFSKESVLDIYISAVRFERGCFGVVEAMQYFWGGVEKDPTNSQAFFLIERVSNVRSRLLVRKVIETAKAARDRGLLDESDMGSLVRLYDHAVQSGKIVATRDQISALRDSLTD